MIIRIIIFLLILRYHKEIYRFIRKHKLGSLSGITEKLDQNLNQVAKVVARSPLEKQMLNLKDLDYRSYQEVRKRLSNIDKIMARIEQDEDLSLRNEYQNVKDIKKKIRNRIKSIVVSKGFHSGGDEILQVIEKHIDDQIQNILEIRDKRGINTEWFEGILYEPVVNYDPQMDVHYDI